MKSRYYVDKEKHKMAFFSEVMTLNMV